MNLCGRTSRCAWCEYLGPCGREDLHAGGHEPGPHVEVAARPEDLSEPV